MDTDIAVALIGIAGTALLGCAAYFYKSSQEIKAIRRAFLSEIRSLSEMIRVRRYVEGLLDCAADLDQGVYGSGAQLSMEIPLDLSSYRPIWGHYASRIGSLKDSDAEQIHRFYQLVDSVARDVSPAGFFMGLLLIVLISRMLLGYCRQLCRLRISFATENRLDTFSTPQRKTPDFL